MPLLINASKGFSEQREALGKVIDDLGLRFQKHTLKVPLGDRVVTCCFWMREPRALARYAYRFITRDHCRVEQLHDPAGGGRVYAGPYTCNYAEREQRRIHTVDPRGVLLLLKLYTDETPITKAMDRCVCPMTMYNMALPLEAMRSHEHALLVAYFSHFPPGLLASLSELQARALRKALHRAAKRALFANFQCDDATALVGEQMVGADGRRDTVFARIIGMSMDYPKIAEWTQTLALRMCWACYTPTGEFWVPFLQYDLRTRESQLSLLDRAWEQFPASHAQRAGWLRPYGLHPEPNEALHASGLDIFQGIPPPPLHLYYQGLLKKFFACSWQAIQRQVSKAEFTRLGKRVDAWLTRLSSSCPWLGCSFPRGLSHFLYGAYTNPNDPWAATVQFGKIASKDVYRGICRFWRLLSIDLFPNCPQMLTLYTDVFDDMELMLRRANTDHSLRVAHVHRTAWQVGAVSLFGRSEFEGMIKFHQPLHLAPFIRGRGGLPWWHDEDGEASLRPNAKNLIRWTNMGPGMEEQLSHAAERRDGVRLLRRALENDDMHGGGAGGGHGGAAGGGAVAAGHVIPPPAPPAGPPTVLMGQRPTVRMRLLDVRRSHPELAQLEFAIRLYLHLAQSPLNDENVHLADMPSLASDVLDMRPGLRILRFPSDIDGCWRGGAYLHAKFSPKQGQGDWQLPRRSADATFIAVRRGGVWWYGELILCFAASYRPDGRSTHDPLCYVRWLDTVAVVAAVEQRTLTVAEATGPFESFRWATHTGSYHRGHPRAREPHYGVIDAAQVRYCAPMQVGPSDSPDAANPLFRLNTDMLRRF